LFVILALEMYTRYFNPENPEQENCTVIIKYSRVNKHRTPQDLPTLVLASSVAKAYCYNTEPISWTRVEEGEMERPVFRVSNGMEKTIKRNQAELRIRQWVM
jgi:hypothetical protein